ncbi:nuclear transcription factor Y subunit gamma-like [Physella acuta]|uniref:nuclear transcription factor Y subunit gamma-like n=1 Tax=Physella acuta TaxID=109671 RepID=UPI0027DB75F6|nr:nuclear transcription factor Y subunit gamma-like [Physella acuta]XP_059149408.1 nuclear transcription factor Y subunit gamma-like [Physella acuta]
MSGDQSYVLQSGISDQAQQMLANFWPNVIENIKQLSANDYKTQELPLARIKKIMKLDEDVKMISAEAPVLFAKAAEIFVSELSLRAWIHTEDNKRRTLQRNDIAMAISKFDQFDFLIDIVPREELKPSKRQEDLNRTGSSLPDQIQFYLQLAQQQSQQAQQTQVVQQQTQQQAQVQVTQATSLQQIQHTPVQQTSASATTNQSTAVQLPSGQIIQQQFQLQSPQAQVIQLPQVSQQVVSPIQNSVMQQLQQQQHSQQLQTQAQAQQQQPTAQVYQQVINASGQLENIPIQLTPQQLQSLQLQLQSKIAGQQIVVQAQQDPNVQFSQAQQIYQLQQAGQQQIFIHSDEQADGGADS